MKITNPVYATDHGGYPFLSIEIDGKPRKVYSEQKPTLIRHGIASISPSTDGEKTTLPDGRSIPFCIRDTELFRYVVAFILDLRADRFEPGQVPNPDTIETQELAKLEIDIEPCAIKNSKPFLAYLDYELVEL
jgi:hypothetical protein